MSRLAKGGLVAALAVVTIGAHEGLRTQAYRDAVGVPTICYGETRGVRLGMVKTKPECDAMLIKALDEFADGMERCAPAIRQAPESRYVAHLSLSYNIGTGGYCRSSVARLFNAGQIRASCDAFLWWDKAGGRALPGLTRRRHEERALCLQGL